MIDQQDNFSMFVRQDMREVSKDEFFKIVGKGNIHPRSEKYFSRWENQQSRVEIARSFPGYLNSGDPARYFVK